MRGAPRQDRNDNLERGERTVRRGRLALPRKAINAVSFRAAARLFVQRGDDHRDRV